MPFIHRSDVNPAWIDYNGHMNDAQYSVFVTLANEQYINSIGMGRDYLESTGKTLYTVEMHIKYLSEVKLENKLEARIHVASNTSKSMNVKTDIYINSEKLAAEAEITYLHYDQNAKKVVDFSESQLAKINETRSW
mgnify:CR=1 FL=1